MRTVNRWNMGLHRFASEEASRYALASVYVEDEQTTATDGHRLVSITTPDPVDLPVITPDFTPDNGKSVHPGFILPAASAQKIERAMPVLKTRPQLGNAIIDSSGIDKDGRNGSIKAATIDKKTNDPRTIEARAIDSIFPKYRNVIPGTDGYKVGSDEGKEPVYTVQFNGEVLGEVLAYLGKFAETETGYNAGHVRLSFYEGAAVRIDATNKKTGQTAIAAVMPISD